MCTRRHFLKSSLATGTALALPTSMTNIGMASAQSADYKALVCVFFLGALDSFDTIIPSDPETYGVWSGVRSSLLGEYRDEGIGNTRARENLLGLNAVNASSLGGREYAVAPELSNIARIFNQGNASVVGNVGPLVVPTTLDQYQAGSVPLPPKLFSHNDQQSLWKTSSPEGAVSGWGGRLADAMYGTTRPIYSAISTSGAPTFLVGDEQMALELRSTTVSPVKGTGESYLGSTELSAILREHFAEAGDGMNNLFAQDFATAQARGVAAANELSELTNNTTEGESIEIEGNGLSRQLAAVAKMISLRNNFGVNRQIFYVATGGFDTHSDQAMRLPALQSGFDEAIGRFYDWTVSQGVSQNVTTFTASDFGRTFTPNATGTDHGWGAHHFVLGGDVRGGRIFGDMDLPEEGHSLNVGRGRLLPTTSVDQYAGQLASWFGVDNAAMSTIFPNYNNFDHTALQLF